MVPLSRPGADGSSGTVDTSAQPAFGPPPRTGKPRWINLGSGDVRPAPSARRQPLIRDRDYGILPRLRVGESYGQTETQAAPPPNPGASPRTGRGGPR